MPARITSLLNVGSYIPGSSPSNTVEGAGFWIGLYEPERFMHIIPHGVWTIEQAAAYRRTLRAATGRMVRAGAYRGAVLDASAYPEQHTDVMRQHSAAMRLARWVFKAKASVYLPHPIIGRRLEAATLEGHQLAFRNPADVMDWLLA